MKLEKEEKICLSTPAQVIHTDEDREEVWENAKKILLDKLYSFMIEKSGWKLKSILGLHIHISKYDPINGSSYIELPIFYKKKKSLVNVLNNDNMCGKWAITISLDTPKKDVGRVTKDVKEKSEKYDWTGVKFPLTVEGIKIF